MKNDKRQLELYKHLKEIFIYELKNKEFIRWTLKKKLLKLEIKGEIKN